VVAGADPGPGGQLGGGGEEGPDVGADLGDDRGRGQLPDAGDGCEQVLLGLLGLRHHLDLGIGPDDHLLQVGEVVQVQAAHQRMMRAEAAFQGHGQVAGQGVAAKPDIS
jgi:hypothetical protein